MKRTGKKKPPIITEGVKIRSFWYVNIEASKTEDGLWEWESIPLEPGENSKSQVVNKLVEYKYPIEKLTWITQSYITSPEDLSVIWEYEALQAWKGEASRIADQVIEAIQNTTHLEE